MLSESFEPLFGRVELRIPIRNSGTVHAVWQTGSKNGIKRADRIILTGEPAWPMIYFGILLAEAVAVPIDFEMPAAEVDRIVEKSEAGLAIIHEDVECTFEIEAAHVGDVFEAEPLAEWEQRNRKDDVASLPRAARRVIQKASC